MKRQDHYDDETAKNATMKKNPRCDFYLHDLEGFFVIDRDCNKMHDLVAAQKDCRKNGSHFGDFCKSQAPRRLRRQNHDSPWHCNCPDGTVSLLFLNGFHTRLKHGKYSFIPTASEQRGNLKNRLVWISPNTTRSVDLVYKGVVVRIRIATCMVEKTHLKCNFKKDGFCLKNLTNSISAIYYSSAPRGARLPQISTATYYIRNHSTALFNCHVGGVSSFLAAAQDPYFLFFYSGVDVGVKLYIDTTIRFGSDKASIVLLWSSLTFTAFSMISLVLFFIIHMIKRKQVTFDDYRINYKMLFS